MILINFILFFQIFSFTHGGKQIQKIRIGAIFHENDSEEEITFRNALHRENKDNTKLEFIPEVYKINPKDSFQAEKFACELALKGVAAIFGPSSTQTSKIVGSVCNELEIPHIISHWASGEKDENAKQHLLTRNFFPSNNFYSQALAQIIEDYEWKGFTLIYDNDDCFERLQDVLEKHEPGDKPINIRQLPDNDNYYELLKLLENTHENHIVIDCSPDKIMNIFKQAATLKMMEEYQSYIVTSLDSHMLDFTRLNNSRANITTIRLMDPSSSELIAAVEHWRSEENQNEGYTQIHEERIKTQTALFYDSVRTFLTSFRELNAMKIIRPTTLQCYQPNNKWNRGLEIIQYLNQKTDNGVTGRIAFDDDGRRINFYMEILELNKNGFKKIAILDPITKKINYTRTEAEVFSQVTLSLQNKTVIVVARLGEPFLTLRKAGEGEHFKGNDRFEGYSKELIEMISQHLGFQYEFRIVKDGQYGSYNKETKTWNGLVKELLDRKADLAICDLTITYERRTAVDFTMPFMTLGISILFAKPYKEPPGLFSFTAPLSLQVWLYVATAYLCVSVLLFLLAKTAADDWENPHPCNSDPEELETIWNMHNCIWLTAGSIMQQGCDILPKAISTRLTAGLWWFFALIVISSYTANLAAFLTMERMDVSIESAEDLAKQSKIKYGAVTGGSTLAFFKESNFSTYQRMWTTMEAAEPSVFAKDNEEGKQRVIRENRKYAFLMESTSIEYIIERNCNLTQVGGLLDSKGYGIAMPVNSPYRTHISRTVLKMQEEGKLQKLKRRWWKIANKTCGEDKSKGDTPELGMDNVGGVFLVLTCGIAISIFIGIMEFFWNVSKVSAAEKITPWKAFKSELLFALDIRITAKPVYNTSSRSASNRSSQSLEENDGIVPGWKFNLEELQKSKV